MIKHFTKPIGIVGAIGAINITIAAFSLFNPSTFLTYSFLALLTGTIILSAYWINRTLNQFHGYRKQTEEKFLYEEDRMRMVNRFIDSIANGRYHEVIESGQNDHLIQAIVEMKDKLQHSSETDKKRSWATQGMAEIGTILRDATTAEQLYANVTRFVVTYTKSNQCGLFILNEDSANDVHLELVSAYAYDRKKFLQKRIDLGEGLTGQAVLEAQTILLTEIPKDYINITSGLGDAPPSTIVIIPLKMNEKVYGVIELASFHRYEPYELEFLERIGESIAASISSARVNEQTRSLLEQSQQQTEELKSQEEEMRQNMEELSATQELMERQVRDTKIMADNLQVRERVFVLTTILSEADPYGNILLANDKLIEVSKFNREELIGKPHNIFRHPDMPKELFKLFWQTIKSGEVFRGVVKNRAKDGTHYWVDATIVPVKDDDGKIVKYIGARYHITNDSVAEFMYNEQAERLGLPKIMESEGILVS